MIGERLTKLRRERKIKQVEVADAIGIHKASMSNYERNRGAPSDNIKIALAKYFNISLDYLMGAIDEPVPMYNDKAFAILPFALDSTEAMMISELIGYLQYRRIMQEQGHGGGA